MAWHTKATGAYDRTSTEAIENAWMIYGLLHARGWTTNAIAGILGNIEYEGGYNPWRWQMNRQTGLDVILASTDTYNIDHSTGHAYGLFQFDPAGKYIHSVAQGAYSQTQLSDSSSYENYLGAIRSRDATTGVLRGNTPTATSPWFSDITRAGSASTYGNLRSYRIPIDDSLVGVFSQTAYQRLLNLGYFVACGSDSNAVYTFGLSQDDVLAGTIPSEYTSFISYQQNGGIYIDAQALKVAYPNTTYLYVSIGSGSSAATIPWYVGKQGIAGYGPNFSDITGKITDGQAQILFVDKHADYIEKPAHPLSYAQFKASTQSAEYLAEVWLYNYERPGEPEKTVNQRRACGAYWYAILTGTEPPEPPGPEPPDPPGPEPPTTRRKMPIWMMTKHFF